MASKTLWAHRVPIYGTVRIYTSGYGRHVGALCGQLGAMDYVVWRALGGPAIRENRVKMVRGNLTEVRSDA